MSFLFHILRSSGFIDILSLWESSVSAVHVHAAIGPKDKDKQTLA